MLNLIKTVFDTITTSAVAWLDQSTSAISGIGSNASLENVPNVVMTIFILIVIFVVVVLVFRWIYSEKDGNTKNAKEKEGLLEGRKSTILTGAILIIGIMLTFIIFGQLGFV